MDSTETCKLISNVEGSQYLQRIPVSDLEKRKYQKFAGCSFDIKVCIQFFV